MAPRVRDLVDAVDRISPLRLAASWDNVGLLLGDQEGPLRRALVTIDLTGPVLAEALDRQVDAVVAYHPPLFHPLKRLVASDPRQAILLDAARAGLALISPHTALDAAAGGMTDWLAEGAGEGTLEPIEPASHRPAGEAFMVVTKCPPAAVNRIRTSMALAGAGRIGEYAECAFELSGRGAFRPGPAAMPHVGRRGVLERAEESRLEMVCAEAVLGPVLAALRAAHPYEEPPIEVTSLAPRPSLSEGQGRILRLLRPATTEALLRRMTSHLGVRRMQVVRPTPAAPPARGAARTSRSARHSAIGLCPGAAAGFIAAAAARGCTLFLTGEARHHEQLEAAALGCTLLLAGHTETERGYLDRYLRRLSEALPGVRFLRSRADSPPAA